MAAYATLVYALCNASDPLQTGFALSGSTVAQGGLCVSFSPSSGYNSPLQLAACANTTAQTWIYDAARQSLRNPSAACGGLSGACIEWSGQEFGTCTFTPPTLAPGCIIGAWPSPASPQTSWNDRFLLDSPSPGMIEAAAVEGEGTGLCVSARPPPPLPVPTADVLAWSQKEVMCLYDIDLCTYAPGQLQGCDCSRPPPPVDAWAPSALDTDSWLAAGQSAGCGIHILVAKHMCGFVSWNSTAGDAALGYNYSSLHSSTPVDVVAAFVASARRAGQDIGMYYSLTNNARTNTCGGTVLPNPAPNQISVTPEQYDGIVRQHLTELWGNYGALSEVWFVRARPQTRSSRASLTFYTRAPCTIHSSQDGGFTPSQREWIPPLLAELQPHAIAFNGETLTPNPSRWIGSESGYAPNETWSTCDYSENGSGGGSPSSATWFPAETDFTVLQGDTWFFDNDVHPVRPPAELRAMYERSVGHNSQALIGIAIPPNGTLVGTAQQAALNTLGAWVRGCYGSPIAQTSGKGLSFTVMPSAPCALDRVVLQEDQATGQRVRAWEVTATLADGSSLNLGQGQSIGNKRILALAEVKEVTMVRLTISSAVGTPVLANFALFGGCSALARELDMPAAPASNVTLHTLFTGDNVVLQSGAPGARVFGSAPAGATVQLTLDGAPAGSALADATGHWEAVLPAQPPSWHAAALVATSGPGSAPAAAQLRFGLVLLCSGQSNMQLNNLQLANGTEEVQAAGAFTGKISLASLQHHGNTTPPWKQGVFIAASAGAQGTVAPFSGLCWLTGKALFEALGGVAPVGLVVGAVGGTPIEAWLPPGVLGATCPVDQPPCGGAADTALYESFIQPLAPFSFGAMLWDQGERDVRCFAPATNRTAAYPCMERALVDTWRSAFKSNFAAAAVQLPGYLGDCSEHGGDYYNCVPGVYNMRLAQEAGLMGVANSSIIPSYDLSCPFGIQTPECPLGSVHNVNKTVVAQRAASALLAAMLPARFPAVPPPRATSLTAAPTGRNYWLVTVEFEAAGPLALQGTQYCTDCCSGAVGDFDASVDGVAFVNGTAQELSGGNVVFIVGLPQKPRFVRFTANQAFPQCAVVSTKGGPPALPFYATVAA